MTIDCRHRFLISATIDYLHRRMTNQTVAQVSADEAVRLICSGAMISDGVTSPESMSRRTYVRTYVRVYEYVTTRIFSADAVKYAPTSQLQKRTRQKSMLVYCSNTKFIGNELR